MANAPRHLVWMDLEMTGLNPDVDHILEMATVITDNDLNILDEGLSFVIHQPAAVIDGMDKWCREQHGKSGLTEEVWESAITLEEAIEKTQELIAKWCPPKTGILCGNSIFQDRAFLRRWAPALDNYLHYRLIDVSSVKELVVRWYPKNGATFFKKSDNHRAMGDVRASIEELRHYRTHFFVE